MANTYNPYSAINAIYNYKKEWELTKEDYMMIDLDRKNTGIEHYSDEYYYNNFLYHNYDYQ